MIPVGESSGMHSGCPVWWDVVTVACGPLRGRCWKLRNLNWERALPLGVARGQCDFDGALENE